MLPERVLGLEDFSLLHTLIMLPSPLLKSCQNFMSLLHLCLCTSIIFSSRRPVHHARAHGSMELCFAALVACFVRRAAVVWFPLLKATPADAKQQPLRNRNPVSLVEVRMFRTRASSFLPLNFLSKTANMRT